jgi:hypothetical protein
MPTTEALPAFIKPQRKITKDHPLERLSKDQVTSSELGTNPRNFWYISRHEDGYDYFLGIPTGELHEGIMHDLKTRSTYSRRCLTQVNTAFGETVKATIHGVVNKTVLTDDQKNLVARYFNPRKETSADVHPEIFTFASAFRHVEADWPMINATEHIEDIPQHDRENLLADLITTGLGVLEHESEYKHIQLAAKRFRLLGESTRLQYYITSDIGAELVERRVPEMNRRNFALEPHSIVYFPNFGQSSKQQGDVIVPVAWMRSAMTHPIPALSSLLYTSSLARDDYFGKLRGSQVYSVKGFGSTESSQQPIAIKRAEGLVAQFIKEVYDYDQRYYFLTPKHDQFTRAIQGKFPKGARHTSNLYYTDPPDHQQFTFIKIN